MRTTRMHTSLAAVSLALIAGIWLGLDRPARSQSDAGLEPAVGVFLKIQGVKGESTDSGHPGWIDVASFSYGLSRSTDGASPARHQGLTIVKDVDKATPFLYLYCSTGQSLDEVVLEVTRTTDEGVSVQEYRLRNATVTSIHTAAGADASRAVERLTLHYEAIEWTYVRADPATGSVVSEVTMQWNPAAEAQP